MILDDVDSRRMEEHKGWPLYKLRAVANDQSLSSLTFPHAAPSSVRHLAPHTYIYIYIYTMVIVQP